jgi:hypothetical protein
MVNLSPYLNALITKRQHVSLLLLLLLAQVL